MQEREELEREREAIRLWDFSPKCFTFGKWEEAEEASLGSEHTVNGRTCGHHRQERERLKLEREREALRREREDLERERQAQLGGEANGKVGPGRTQDQVGPGRTR